MHLLLQARVGDDERATVKDVVADPGVEPRLERLDECRASVGRDRVHLGQALGKAVGHLDLAARERAQKLLLVVAHDAQRGACLHHARDDPHGVEDARPAVNEVAEEERHPAARVAVHGAGVEAHPVAPFGDLVPEGGQERLELVGAAVDVADDVERPVPGPCGCSRAAGARRPTSSTSSGLSTQTCRNPSRPSPPIERLSDWRWRARTCGPKSRSARSRLRSSQMRSGMSSTIATGSTW